MGYDRDLHPMAAAPFIHYGGHMKHNIAYFVLGVFCMMVLVFGAELAFAQSQEPANQPGTYTLNSQILQNGHVLVSVLDTRTGKIVDVVKYSGLSSLGADDWDRRDLPDYSEFTPGK